MTERVPSPQLRIVSVQSPQGMEARDHLGADAVLSRHVRDRLGVGLPEDRDHLVVGESGLHSLAAPRAPFSQVSAGPKIARQVTAVSNRSQ